MSEGPSVTTPDRPLRRTPLYAAHRALSARMVDFAGWEMPVQYQGVIDEHVAVRTRAGLFDVSHMGEIEIRGPGALTVCQRLTVNDAARLQDGRAQYTLVCLPDGGVIDDVILYRLSEQRYLFCVNAGNRDAAVQWMQEHGSGADVIDRGDDFAQLALQGPQATTILARLTAIPLEQVPPFAFREGSVAGQQALVARTGYTGEDGWELYCDPVAAPALWADVLATGAADGLVPVGLGARDTLRLEAALPLYGHELGRDTTPLEAGLDRFVRLDKAGFIGRDALVRQRETGLRRQLVGFYMVDPGIARQGYAIEHAGRTVGQVTSGTKSPTLGKAIGLGYVSPGCAAGHTKLGVSIRGRIVGAETVPLPFYRRKRIARSTTA